MSQLVSGEVEHVGMYGLGRSNGHHKVELLAANGTRILCSVFEHAHDALQHLVKGAKVTLRVEAPTGDNYFGVDYNIPKGGVVKFAPPANGIA